MSASTEKPVRLDASDSQAIKVIFGHADTEAVIATIEGTGIPLPEEGEPVRFGEIRPDGREQEVTFGEERYVVVDREYQYFEIDTEEVAGRDEPAYLVTVVVRVLPEAANGE